MGYVYADTFMEGSMTVNPYGFEDIEFDNKAKMGTREGKKSFNLSMLLALEKGEKCSTCGQSDRASVVLKAYHFLLNGIAEETPTKWKTFWNTIQIAGTGGAIAVFLTLEKLRMVDGEGFSYYWEQVLGKIFSLG